MTLQNDNHQNDPTVILQKMLPILKKEIGEESYRSYLAQASIANGDELNIFLVTQTNYARDWLKKHATMSLTRNWAHLDPKKRDLKIISKLDHQGLNADLLFVESLPVPVEGAVDKKHSAAHDKTPTEKAGQKIVGLQAKLTFETFVSGPANQFALETARKIAAFQAGPFNPFFFHGPYGQGKTHLLNAIGWAAQKARPDARIIYLTAEKFTTTFIRSLMDKSMSHFKDELRSADLLLVDDVHFIGGKQSSQEELFHTLTSLMESRVSVVFTADRAPTLLTEIDTRLRSYLSAGLVCGLEEADAELKLGIVEKKLIQLQESFGFKNLPKAEIIHFLADKVPGTVRELEGAVNTLVASSGHRLDELTLQDAINILMPNLKVVIDRRITVDEIQKCVCDYYGIKQADLLSERRTRILARPRQVAMWLCKKLTSRSLPDIGRRFGNRDHTTVLHAVRKIDELIISDEQILRDTEALTRRLRNG